jgi:hypothetical protein
MCTDIGRNFTGFGGEAIDGHGRAMP